MICRWVEEGPDSYAFKQHVLKIRDFMWLSKDGMMMCGTNGELFSCRAAGDFAE